MKPEHYDLMSEKVWEILPAIATLVDRTIQKYGSYNERQIIWAVIQRIQLVDRLPHNYTQLQLEEAMRECLMREGLIDHPYDDHRYGSPTHAAFGDSWYYANCPEAW